MPDLIRSSTIGVAGCGAMGLPMARRMRNAGYEVWGLDVRPVKEFGDFEQRMIIDPGEFAAQCDIVISVVRDARESLDLLFEVQAILATERPPSMLIVSSTLSPVFLHEIAARIPKETNLVDAPMSGAPHAAEAGTLTFMLGGSPADINHVRPLFASMGKTIHHLGPFGSGMAFKVCNNFVAAASVVASRRAYEVARSLGLDTDMLRRVMSTSSGGTWYGDNFDSISWAREGYETGNTMAILEKDVAAFREALDTLADFTDDPFDQSVIESLRQLKPEP